MVLKNKYAKLKEQLKLMQHQIFGNNSVSHVGEPINSEDAELQIVSGYTCCQKEKKSYIRTINTNILL